MRSPTRTISARVVEALESRRLLSFSPTGSYTVSQSLSNGHWIATPSDVGNTAKVEFLVDGVVKWSEASSPYQFNGDPYGTLVLPAGPHTLQVRATSKTGSVALSSVYNL